MARLCRARPLFHLCRLGAYGLISSRRGRAVSIDVRIRADEVRGVIDASGTLPFRNLRIGAQRSGAIRHAVGEMSCDDFLRRLSMLDPLVQGTNGVKRIWTRT